MKHVAVLKGGWSAEREVSLVSGAAVAAALAGAGYRVSEIDVGPDIAARLADLRPDVAFNALHGRGGEDGTIQGLLEVLRLPYTHSGVLASALALDKPLAKQVFVAHGLRCPDGLLLAPEVVAAGHPMAVPYVIKPSNEGSTVGVRIVKSAGETPFGNLAWSWGKVMVETYIPGRELSVAVLDGRALGVIEILPKTGFYDYEAKYAPGMSAHVMPAPLPPPVYAAAMAAAAQAHLCLGCRGVSRADFRFDEARGIDGLYLLEINTQPGMTPTSLVPEIAAAGGMDFPALVSWMVEDAGLDR